MSLFDLGTQQVGAMDFESAYKAQYSILRSRSTASNPGQGGNAPMNLEVEKRVNFPGRRVKARLTIDSQVFASTPQPAAFNIEIIGKLHSWARSSSGNGSSNYHTHTQPLLHLATSVSIADEGASRAGSIAASRTRDMQAHRMTWELTAVLPTQYQDRDHRLPLPSTFEGKESSAMNFSLIDGVLKPYVSYYWRVTSKHSIRGVLKVPFLVCSTSEHTEPIRSMTHPSIASPNTIPHIPSDWKAYTSGVRDINKRLITKATLEVILLMPPPVYVTPCTQVPFFLHFKMHAKNESDFDPVKTRMPLIPGQLRPPKEAELDGPVRFTMQRHVRMKTNALLGSYTHTTEEETHIPARWMGTRGNEDIPGFHWSQPKRIDAPKYFWKSEALIGGYLLPQVIPAMSSNHLSYSYALRLRVPIAGTGNGWDRTVCGWGAVGLRNSDIDALGSHASQAVLGERAAAKLPGFELPHEGGSGPPFDGPPGFPMVNDLPLPDEASGLPAYHRVPQAGEQTAIAPARRSNATSNVATGSMPVATPAAVPTASDGYNKQPW